MRNEAKVMIDRVLKLKDAPYNLTELKICDRLRISFSALQRWKSGVASPTLDTYCRVCSELDKIEKSKKEKAVAKK